MLWAISFASYRYTDRETYACKIHNIITNVAILCSLESFIYDVNVFAFIKMSFFYMLIFHHSKSMHAIHTYIHTLSYTINSYASSVITFQFLLCCINRFNSRNANKKYRHNDLIKMMRMQLIYSRLRH